MSKRGDPYRYPNAKVRRAAEKLRTYRGVAGVFYGHGRRGGQWMREDCLCAHVRWKRSSDRIKPVDRLPSEIDGIPVDVLEIGTARLHLLDHMDRAFSSVGEASAGSIAAFARHGGFTYALLSGHASLPPERTTFPADPDEFWSLTFDDIGFESRLAHLVRGAFGENGSVDYALAELSMLESEQDAVSTFHTLAQTSPPLPVRSTPLELGDEVLLYSPNKARARTVRGVFAGVDEGPVQLDVGPGFPVSYRRVLKFRPADGVPFSVPGDSGGLIVEGESVGGVHRAVAVVLGGSFNGLVSYGLAVQNLRAPLRELYDVFFGGSI